MFVQCLTSLTVERDAGSVRIPRTQDPGAEPDAGDGSSERDQARGVSTVTPRADGTDPGRHREPGELRQPRRGGRADATEREQTPAGPSARAGVSRQASSDSSATGPCVRL